MGSRETLKLLKISDDSKNFSDLDLPEITNQRKRKVRRKTRPRLVSSSSSNSNPNQSDATTVSGGAGGTPFSSYKQCNILVIWMIFITICWLLTLSYMIAVIHSENLRLEVQIKQLQGATQNIPEIQQKWHETTKQLQDNQTEIHTKLLEFQRNLENLTLKLNEFVLKVDSTKTFTKEDFSKFGAEVKAASGDVEQIKERLAELKTTQDKLNGNLSNLTDSVNSSLKNNSSSAINPESLQKFQDKLTDNYNNLNKTLESLVNTVQQKTKNLNDEQISTSEKLEELKDQTANMTSRVASMRTEWSTIRDKTISNEMEIKLIKSDLEGVRNFTKFLGSSMDEIRSVIRKPLSSDSFSSDISEILSTPTKKPEIPAPVLVTTTTTTLRPEIMH